jgi:hypothetical protein
MVVGEEELVGAQIVEKGGIVGGVEGIKIVGRG